MYTNELTFRNHENGFKVAEMLLKEDYVVMLSYEEKLLVLNYEWSERGADRNDMIFMHREDYEEEISAMYEEIRNSMEGK